MSDEEARYFLNEKEHVNLDEFIEDAWPRIKPFLMLDAKVFQPPSGEGEVEEVPLNGKEEEEEEEEYDEGNKTKSIPIF